MSTSNLDFKPARVKCLLNLQLDRLVWPRFEQPIKLHILEATLFNSLFPHAAQFHNYRCSRKERVKRQQSLLIRALALEHYDDGDPYSVFIRLAGTEERVSSLVRREWTM